MDARFVARDGRPGALKAPGFRVERAYLVLNGLQSFRSDLAELETDLAIELDRIGFPGGFLPSPLREARVKLSAGRLAQAAPAAADPWCGLALAEAKTSEGSQRAIEGRLRRCFALGPREIRLLEPRIHLALALWEQLPRDVRTAAMLDIATGLKDADFGGWTLERLAYGVAIVAPARESVVLPLIEQYGAEREQQFKNLIASYRARYGNQLGEFPAR